MAKSRKVQRRGKPPDDKLAKRRRLELLDAAYALIAEKGIEGLRTRDIATRAGVNIATLHYYYATKEVLLVALVHHVSDIFMAPEARRRTPAKGRPLASLAAHLANAWSRFEDNPQLATVLLELMLRARRDAVARQALGAVQASWNGLVAAILRRGIASGELRADLAPRLAAAVVTSFVIGAAMQLGLRPRAFAFAAAVGEFERWLGAARPAGYRTR